MTEPGWTLTVIGERTENRLFTDSCAANESKTGIEHLKSYE
jgi:hypothetical protein